MVKDFCELRLTDGPGRRIQCSQGGWWEQQARHQMGDVAVDEPTASKPNRAGFYDRKVLYGSWFPREGRLKSKITLRGKLNAASAMETQDMPTKTFTGGRIKKADYDPVSRQLDLHWDNKTVLAYKHVPEEVYRRLCSAPNPATYWEDRIAEEYPKGIPRTSAPNTEGEKKLRDLFGNED